MFNFDHIFYVDLHFFCGKVGESSHNSPLDNSPYTPWQKVLIREFSAKGILADNVCVAYNEELRPHLVESPL